MKKQAARSAPPPPELPGSPVAAPAPASAPPATALPRVHVDAITQAIVRHWRVAALVAAAVTLLAWLVAAVQPKRYRATSIGAVTPAVAQLTPSEVIRGVETLERRVIVASVAALAGTPVARKEARAGDDYAITAVVMPNTNLFRIEVEGPDPQRAAAIANQVPTVLSAHARTMYRLYGVHLVSAASTPDKPATPRLGRALAAGLVLGVLLGAAAAWLLDRRLGI